MRLLLVMVLCAAADEGWQHYADKNGITVERRAVEGSKFYEHRARVSVKKRPQVVLDAIWWGVMNALPKTVKKRTLLRSSENEVLVYDELKTPVVSDRDATIRIWRTGNEIRFETHNELGPPPNSKYVRLPVVRGYWSVEPEGDGARLSYICYSEPGGSIPAWMVRGPQADQLFVDVQRILGILPP